MSEDILAKIVRMRKADIERLGLNFGIDIPETRRVGHTEFLGNAGAILEVKRASPSKGDIAPDLVPTELATTYAEAHAQAVSVLTELVRWRIYLKVSLACRTNKGMKNMV